MKLGNREVEHGKRQQTMTEYASLDARLASLEALIEKRLHVSAYCEKSKLSEASYWTITDRANDEHSVQFTIRNHYAHDGSEEMTIFWMSHFETWTALRNAVLALLDAEFSRLTKSLKTPVLKKSMDILGTIYSEEWPIENAEYHGRVNNMPDFSNRLLAGEKITIENTTYSVIYK